MPREYKLIDKDHALLCGIKAHVTKDGWDGLWRIRYEETPKSTYAGPFKTRKEAREMLADHIAKYSED